MFGIGAEEMGHVEMLAIMIAQLLEKSPLGITDDAVQDDPVVAAVVGGTDVQQAIEELKAEGAEELPVPSNFPKSKERGEVAYQYLNFSDGAAAAEGSWASGPTPDGKGEFRYHDGPTTSAPMPAPTHPDARFYGTTELPNMVEKAAGAVQDKLNRE